MMKIHCLEVENMAVYSIPRLINMEKVCVRVLDVKNLKMKVNFGELVLIASHAIYYTVRNGDRKIKNNIEKIIRDYGVLRTQGNVKNVGMHLLVKGLKENIAQQNVNSLEKSSKEKMDVGNGKAIFIQMDMRIQQIMRQIRESMFIELVLGYLMVIFLKNYMYAINVITESVSLLNIFFWGQLKKICLMPKIKEGWNILSSWLQKEKKILIPSLMMIKLGLSGKKYQKVLDVQ